jgi:Spy/CpxP family protein refolding chaperone
MKTNGSKRKLPVLTLLLGLTAAFPTFAQEPGANNTPQQRQAETQQPQQVNQDPLANLQLTGEQRAAIRAIRIANKDEQNASRERLERARIALEDALDAEYPDESLIEQRVRAVGEAQVAQVRMRSLQEVRIRRVLTPAQQATLRELRLRAREEEAHRQQRRQNQNQEIRRQRNGNTQGNGVAPGLGGRPNNRLRRP